MPSFGDFVHAQFKLKIEPPKTSFSSKTVIVTGANGGLGKEIVKHIIRLDASQVIFACRSQSKGNQAKREIEALLKCNSGIIQVWELDLESAASVKSFVEKANTLPRVDVLINNAGIQAFGNNKAVYDTERTLAVNIIGTFLLSLLLLPKLRRTAQEYRVTPHMTMVTSALYDVAKYPEKHGDDIFTWSKDESHVDQMNQYNLSKLLQLYATIKLSSIIDPIDTDNPTPIVINSLDPCFCKTGLANGLTGVLKVVLKVFEWIAARPAEEGAALVVKAACAGRQTHGRYMRSGEVQEYKPIVLDEGKAAEVWEALCRRLERIQPGILLNLY